MPRKLLAACWVTLGIYCSQAASALSKYYLSPGEVITHRCRGLECLFSFHRNKKRPMSPYISREDGNIFDSDIDAPRGIHLAIRAAAPPDMRWMRHGGRRTCDGCAIVDAVLDCIERVSRHRFEDACLVKLCSYIIRFPADVLWLVWSYSFSFRYDF